MSWSYVDAGCILHIVDDEETAKQNAKRSKKYIETNIKSMNNMPLVNIDGEYKKIMVYNIGEAYIDGDAYNGKRVPLENFPEIYNLYKQLM